MDIAALLNPRCPCNRNHKIWDQGLCWFCLKDQGLLVEPELTPDAKAMWARIGAVAARIPERGYRSEAETYREGIFDDD